MFVEYHPLTPRRRAFSPGATIVLMSVCPVFRSLPARGDLVCAASATRAGMSAVRFGAAFVYGMPSRIAAYAYTMLDGIDGSFSSSPRSKVLIEACAGDCVMKISVL